MIQQRKDRTGVKGDRQVIEPGFLTVVFTAYPFSSSIFMNAEPMYLVATGRHRRRVASVAEKKIFLLLLHLKKNHLNQ
jgi:hypothetical protein